jgi:hypothetical protein
MRGAGVRGLSSSNAALPAKRVPGLRRSAMRRRVSCGEWWRLLAGQQNAAPIASVGGVITAGGQVAKAAPRWRPGGLL